MTTLILSNEMTPSELYHVAYTAGYCDQLIDTTEILDREDVDLEYLMDEYEEGRDAFLVELNTK